MADPVIDRAVILAGGGGKRLWPWTGPALPKPLLPLGGGGQSLLSATIDRLEGLTAPGHLRVQASPSLGVVLVAADRRLGPGALGTEPSPRDTAPAIALAMRRILDEDPAAVTAILPADQRVADRAAFGRALERAAAAARAGQLVTLGIAPSRPATEFGYIACGGDLAGLDGVRCVERFIEKPNATQVEVFLREDRYLWNGGIFVWQAETFWRALEEHAPGVAGPVARYHETGDRDAWNEAERTSIDYALMERATRVASVPLDAGWNDIGGWEAVAELARAGEAGPAALCEIRGPAAADSLALEIGDQVAGPLVLVGEYALLVVRGPNGTLVTPRQRVAEMKPLVP